MFNTSKSVTTGHKSTSGGTSFLVFIAVVSGAFLSYFIGFLVFLNQHPIHWAMSIVGGVVGWLIGKLIYRARGEKDII